MNIKHQKNEDAILAEQEDLFPQAKKDLNRIRRLRLSLRDCDSVTEEIDFDLQRIYVRRVRDDLYRIRRENLLEIERIKGELSERMARIDRLPAPYNEYLRLRYAEDLRVKEIANSMHYSCDWIRHIHSKALEAYELNIAERLNDGKENSDRKARGRSDEDP